MCTKIEPAVDDVNKKDFLSLFSINTSLKLYFDRSNCDDYLGIGHTIRVASLSSPLSVHLHRNNSLAWIYCKNRVYSFHSAYNLIPLGGRDQQAVEGLSLHAINNNTIPRNNKIITLRCHLVLCVQEVRGLGITSRTHGRDHDPILCFIVAWTE